jgi:carnitine-CoA ligase
VSYSGVWTMGAIVATRAAEQPNRRAVQFESIAVTYGEWDALGNQVANALLSLGFEPHSRVAVMLSNQPEFLGAWLGVAKAGLIEVPVNTAYKGDLLAYLLEHAQCEALIIDARWVGRVEAVLDELKFLRLVVVVGGEPGDLGALTTISWTAFLDTASTTAPDVQVSQEDVSAILYTSGTTGPSKGVVLTHAANFYLARNCVELMSYGPSDVVFNAFPLFHVNARYSGLLPVMYADGESVLYSRFSASRFWDTCREHGVTAFNYMGALLMMLHKQPERPDDADNPVRRAYGAPAPVTIYKEFEQRFGLQLVEVYGSTEGGTITMNTVESFRVGSCGRPVPYFDVRIHDEHDHPLPPGEVGEIVVRPREPHALFERYHDMPEETLTAFRNLWFHTGDRGTTDEDGYFYYVDRMKDAIRRRGENISSWEVEKVVTTHESVAEAAAIGVPSELTEEEVLIVVVAKPGYEIDPISLLDLCQERLPHYAVPRYVRITDELPKTPSQRIEKYRLRAEGLPPGTWDRDDHGYEVRR